MPQATKQNHTLRQKTEQLKLPFHHPIPIRENRQKKTRMARGVPGASGPILHAASRAGDAGFKDDLESVIFLHCAGRHILHFLLGSSGNSINRALNL